MTLTDNNRVVLSFKRFYYIHMIKKVFELYIAAFEKLTEIVRRTGAKLGLELTSGKYWKLLNVMYGHTFDMRVRHKIFQPEND